MPSRNHRAEEYNNGTENNKNKLLEGFSNRLEEGEDRIRELQDRAGELIQSEQENKNEDSLGDLPLSEK